MSVKREREVLWRSVSEYHVGSAPLREVCALHVNVARFRMCVAHSRAARCHDGQYGPLDQSRAGLTFVGYVLSTSSSPKFVAGHATSRSASRVLRCYRTYSTSRSL